MFTNNNDVLNAIKGQNENHLKMMLEMGRIGSALVDIQKMMTKTLQTYTSENVVLQTYSQTFRAEGYLYNSLTVGDAAQNDNAKLIIDGIVPSFTIPLLAGINSVNIPDGATYTVTTTSGNPVTAVLTRYNTPGDNDTNVSIVGNSTVQIGDNVNSNNKSSVSTTAGVSDANNTHFNSLSVVPYSQLFNGVAWDRARSTGGLDAQAATGIQAVGGFNFNGTTFDRVYNNTQGIALASNARTANTNSPNLNNLNARGIQIILRVGAASGTGGLNLYIQGQSANGYVYWMNVALASPITAIGTYVYELYPGASGTSGDVKQRTSGTLPRTWAVSVQHNDATSYTYEVDYALIL